MKKSNSNKALLYAVKKGYVIMEDGTVLYKNKKRKFKKINGYYCFTIRVNFDEYRVFKNVFVHRLQAYSKYGAKIFKKGIEVRHLDSNPLNNQESNIAIGTTKQNSNDKDSNTRMRVALNATSFVRKHNHEKIIKMKSEGKSYNEIMTELKIKSKGTISYVINRSLKSKLK